MKYELEPSCLGLEFTSQAEFGILIDVVNVILRQPLLRGTEVVTPRSCHLRMHIVVKAASTRRVSYRQFGTVHFEPKVCGSLRGSDVLGGHMAWR